MSDSEGLVAAAASGDRVAALRALRDRLAREIDGCESSRDVAALAARFQTVVNELDAAKPAEGGSFLDELANRRRGRQSEAQTS